MPRSKAVAMPIAIESEETPRTDEGTEGGTVKALLAVYLKKGLLFCTVCRKDSAALV